MSKVNAIGLVYSFSEANHAVFQNAGIWKLKRELNIDTWAYAPREYAALYWSAATTHVISPAPYGSSREIQMYSLNPISRTTPRSWFTRGGYHFFKLEILKRMPAFLLHSLPVSFRHDYKSKRYLFDSGIYDFVENHFKNSVPCGKFVGTSFYTDPSNFKKLKMNLTNHFQISFQNLKDQIESGTFAEFNIYKIGLTEVETEVVEKILEFRRRQEKAIFLRTRNIDNQVSFQNANPLQLKPIIEFLLDSDIAIVHSGTPPVKLGIEHKNYLEVSHDLPVGTELAIAQDFSAVMQSAWAGLFTAVSTLNINLITFDDEWSLRNLPIPISLMKAREVAGKKDFQLGKILSQNYSITDIGSQILAILERY